MTPDEVQNEIDEFNDEAWQELQWGQTPKRFGKKRKLSILMTIYPNNASIFHRLRPVRDLSSRNESIPPLYNYN